MPIQHAVLALLSQGDSYGYVLRSEFEETIGPQWGSLNIGHLYQVLDRLVRDGLVTAARVEQTSRPDRILYRLTDEGQAELDGWLATPFVRQSGYRDDFFLKLLAASRLGRKDLGRVLAVQRQAYLDELQTLAQLRDTHDSEPLVRLLIEAAILHTQANLQVVELAEEQQPKLVEMRRRARAMRDRGSVRRRRRA
jgi:DNA-binding PadR family transcriptional regulator